MNTGELFDPERRSKAGIALAACLVVLLGAVVVAWLVQRGFGSVEVTNLTYENWNGIRVRAKLLRPVEATVENPLPGAVYIHGYQNNRETSDPYCIEMARRGFVMLCIDAIGRATRGYPVIQPIQTLTRPMVGRLHYRSSSLCPTWMARAPA